MASPEEIKHALMTTSWRHVVLVADRNRRHRTARSVPDNPRGWPSRMARVFGDRREGGFDSGNCDLDPACSLPPVGVRPCPLRWGRGRPATGPSPAAVTVPPGPSCPFQRRLLAGPVQAAGAGRSHLTSRDPGRVPRQHPAGRRRPDAMAHLPSAFATNCDGSNTPPQDSSGAPVISQPLTHTDIRSRTAPRLPGNPGPATDRLEALETRFEQAGLEYWDARRRSVT